jgi:TonB family protein
MKKARCLFAAYFLLLAYGGSSCENLAITGHTAGLIKFIRPQVDTTYHGKKTAVFEDTRFLPDTEIEVGKGSRATLLFDGGVKVVVDGDSRLRAVSQDEIMLLKGRVFIEADEKEEMKVGADNGRLAVIDSAVSIESRDGRVSAYTYSGELSYSFQAGSGLLRAGESLTVAGGKAEVQPEELWADWTGGLAEAGPRTMDNITGIGQIYARLPGAAGQARWPLIIRRHEVRVTIKGDLAVTETMQEFFNPASDTMEGIYRLRIPEDAILQRFAVDRGGKLVDGIIREKATAKQDYQAHVYQGSTSDPALLEWVAPGSFKASIYPIKPGAVRVIAYRYSQWLRPSGEKGDMRTYVYPVGNETIAPKIGEFYFVADLSDVKTDRIQAGAGARIEKGRVVFAQSDFRPRSDFYIQLLGVEKSLGEDEVLMVKADYQGLIEGLKSDRNEQYLYSQFVLRDDAIDVEPQENLKIAVALDMSAATEQHLVDLSMTFVESLLGQLREGDQVAVFAGDIETHILGQQDRKLSGATEQIRDAVMDAAARRTIGGATDIGRLIMDTAAVASKEPGGVVVYVGDGFPTVGELDLGGLKEKLKRLPNNVKLYGVGLGEESNLDLLAGLCSERGLARRIIDRVEAAETAIDILADATTPTVENLAYEIDGGIERVYPAEIAMLKVTDPVRLIGRLTGEKDPKTITLKGTAGGKPFKKTYKVEIDKIDDLGDLRLRWAGKRLMSLLEQEEGPESVIELGTRYGIITPYTSFYVPPEEDSYNLPEAPTFEIFELMEGARSAAGRGGGETTLAEALVGIFLPYGCCKSLGKGGGEAPPEQATTESKPSYGPPGSKSEGEEAPAADERWSKKADNMYGIKGPADNADKHLAQEEAMPAEAEAEKDYGGEGARDQKEAVAGPAGILQAMDEDSGKLGGGTGEGTIGLGGLETIGHGGGGGSGVGYGRGAGGLYDKSESKPTIQPGTASVQGSLSKEVIRRIIKQHLNEVRYCYEKSLVAQPGLGGKMAVKFTISPTGAVEAANVSTSTMGAPDVESCVAQAFERWTFPAPEGGGTVNVTYPLAFAPSGKEAEVPVEPTATASALEAVVAPEKKAKGAQETTTKTKIYFEQEIYVSNVEPSGLSENTKKCLETSIMPVDEKKALWVERLGSGPSLAAVMEVFREAKKTCEIKSAADQRAFARVVLGLLGGVQARCGFYKQMRGFPALASYIKEKILASLSSPDAVKTAMESCDGAIFLTPSEVDKMLAKIKDMDGKIVAVKKLIALYPEDLQLKLRLLDMLEDAGRKEEAVRFADLLRADPYADDEVRTRVGEFFIRAGDMEQAKRALSEIVEFAPWSYQARRRLGDLYRAYGWYEDAYRQYETLSKMAPNDDAVLILLADAAILAGRSDEGLRVLEQVSQSEPSFEGKISPAEVARIYASLTLAEMRVKARADKDEKKVKKLVDRTRKAGVLRDAEKLKIVLSWAHPDAVFGLAVKFPGSELARPFKSAPTLGLQWVTDKSAPGGDILVQVERLPGSVVKEAKGTLYVIESEGDKTETLQKVDVVLTKKDETKKAWTVSPGGKVAEAKIDKTAPLDL